MSPDFTPLTGLLGGALIGLAAVLLLIANGRIAGVSGIVGGLLMFSSGLPTPAPPSLRPPLRRARR